MNRLKSFIVKISFRGDIQIFLTTYPFLIYFLKNLIFSYQGKERPAKKKFGDGKTPHSVSLHGVDSALS